MRDKTTKPSNMTKLSRIWDNLSAEIDWELNRNYKLEAAFNGKLGAVFLLIQPDKGLYCYKLLSVS